MKLSLSEVEDILREDLEGRPPPSDAVLWEILFDLEVGNDEGALSLPPSTPIFMRPTVRCGA